MGNEYGYLFDDGDVKNDSKSMSNEMERLMQERISSARAEKGITSESVKPVEDSGFGVIDLSSLGLDTEAVPNVEDFNALADALDGVPDAESVDGGPLSDSNYSFEVKDTEKQSGYEKAREERRKEIDEALCKIGDGLSKTAVLGILLVILIVGFGLLYFMLSSRMGSTDIVNQFF